MNLANSIPVIDLSPVISGRNPENVAAEIYDAIVSVGFFQIVGHGVPQSLIDAAYSGFDVLFTRSTDEKCTWESAAGNPFRGYSRQTKGNDDGAIIESFEIASIGSAEEAAARGVAPQYLDYFDSYTWPEIEGFRAAVSDLFDATRALGRTMMSLFARALGMSANYFEKMLVNDVTNFACKYYSASEQLPDQRVLLGEHGDTGMLTLLHQRGTYEGLQVKLTSGERITVPVREDAFVVNVGQLMTRWTNNLFPATLHRVITPPTPADSRKSMVTFYLPAVDTVIEPLDSCVGEDGPYYLPTTPYAEQTKAARRTAALERL